MDKDLFDQVDDIVRSLSACDVDRMRTRAHRYGIKLWFNDEKPTRLHYEAQMLGRKNIDGVKGIALEIGFHAEHRNEAENEAALAALLAKEKSWRKTLGKEATAGPFFGADNWRRLSDVWLDPDLSGEDVAFEIASRLVDYVDALEPLVAAYNEDA